MNELNTVNALYSRWGRSIDQDCPLNDYPRPQLRRDQWACLNGKWSYAIREDNETPQTWDGEILVPYSPESLLSGVGRQLLPGQTLWYRRSFQMEPLADNTRRILHFGAVDSNCRVWCNDSLLGEHAGGYWPFSFDLTDTISEDDHFTLTIAVQDDSDGGDEAYGKQKIKRGGIWYTGQSGIWQTVWTEDVPKVHIRSLKITPLWRESAIDIQIDTDAPSATVRLLDDGTTISTASVHNGSDRLRLDDFRSWSPDDPYLYDLEITAEEDTVYSYVGMREFNIIANAQGTPTLTLNGKPIFHNGVLDQGYWSDGMYTPPSDDAMVWEISQVKEMGFNMLRKHIKIEPLRWYYHCDRLGILVWQDFVSGGGPYKSWVIQVAPFLGIHYGDGPKRYALHGRDSAAGRQNFKRDAERTVDLLYNTTSLAVWVPFNEAWGQFDAAATSEWLRQRDPTRQIDHASGYFDQGAGDFHSYHIYYKRFKPKQDKQNGRVLALTEFGGYSLATEGHMATDRRFGYKVLNSKADLQQALQQLYDFDIFPNIEKGMGALVYTQVSDVEDEINGLFTYDREVTKFDIDVLQQINQQVYDSFEKQNNFR